MRLRFIKCHGSGNDFPLIDARDLALTDTQWAVVARALSDRGGPVGSDGLLLLTGDAATGERPGMRMFNPDGSEAETCLNGLRCTARLAFEVGGQAEMMMHLKTSTADVRRVDPIAPGVVTVETRVGPVSTRSRDVGLTHGVDHVVFATIPGLPSLRRFTAVAMPNPHLISFVDTVDEEELVALGDWCESAPPLIPGRANVSFVELRGRDLYVRTYERGVGLTNSCGSAMAASTFAAALNGRVAFDRWLTVFNRGGMVGAMASAPHGPSADPAAGASASVPANMVAIRGNATFEFDAEVEVDLDTGALGAFHIVNRRDDEVLAWTDAVAALSTVDQPRTGQSRSWTSE
ncbi:diaminopimelate epimerase [Sphingomonas sp. SFZ2018-12]|uniref:diaminopimelate epimerase n=1 Tax=Sphingomonas sp. SFZ2018-12 TaxID=2683197 RepID=UPI001F0F6EA4|nr:diaminopimelate epimerase [Sphingomonas sp. SFZ2018-12]MCH4894234.1 diaminopimelate epimerase [Sphingomonas sp. SFZ2018-12]